MIEKFAYLFTTDLIVLIALNSHFVFPELCSKTQNFNFFPQIFLYKTFVNSLNI